MGGSMFGDLGGPVAATSERQPGEPRLLRVNRRQVLPRPVDLDRLLPEDHRARAVWDFAAGLDSSTPIEDTRAVAGHSGQPIVNAQPAMDTETQVIVGGAVANAGSDARELPPMVDRIGDRCGKVPEVTPVEGGFATLESLAAASGRTTLHAPAMEPKDKGRDPLWPRTDDTEAMGAWRVRMGTEAAQRIQEERAATTECVNAPARNRGRGRIPVRGTGKALAVMLRFALAHDVMRAVTPLAG